ncbi:MAG: hypothetical protein RL324_1765 [Verrucomicrobiota bacterium]
MISTSPGITQKTGPIFHPIARQSHISFRPEGGAQSSPRTPSACRVATSQQVCYPEPLAAIRPPSGRHQAAMPQPPCSQAAASKPRSPKDGAKDSRLLASLPPEGLGRTTCSNASRTGFTPCSHELRTRFSGPPPKPARSFGRDPTELRRRFSGASLGRQTKRSTGIGPYFVTFLTRQAGKSHNVRPSPYGSAVASNSANVAHQRTARRIPMTTNRRRPGGSDPKLASVPN